MYKMSTYSFLRILGHNILVSIKFTFSGENVGCWDTSDRKRKGHGYDGNQSRTRNGYTCKNWRETGYYNSK